MSGAVPNAERNAATCVSLPMYPELTDAEVDYVVGKVLEWDKAREVMTRYRVVVVGMGKRGVHHATAFAANPRFELAGICSRDPAAAGRRGREARRREDEHGSVGARRAR